ncbi:hypothetical protein [Sphingobium sp. CR28]|uniref:hypothetical protein n=1 Tax=Sphingobium sp. CR28 TaxID=3400272 RepID=UPI003FF13D9E
MFTRFAIVAPFALLAALPVQSIAATPRELLTTAAFQTTEKAKALALIGQAITEADKILAERPGDREATLQRGLAIGYRGKLTRSRTDARASIGIFEALAARNPRDAEAQIVIAGWHLDAIDQLGGFLARSVVGAKRTVGEEALARAVALDSKRAFFPGIAALMSIRLDKSNLKQARQWAEAAAIAPTPTPIDAQMRRSAIALLPTLRGNDAKGAAELARKLLPFGGLKD